MRHIFFCTTLLVFATILIACTQHAASNDDSPTGAYKRLFAAVKSKNTEAIKAVCSKKTIDLANFAASKQNKPVDQVFANGFTATTFADSLPEIRDERIK